MGFVLEGYIWLLNSIIIPNTGKKFLIFLLSVNKYQDLFLDKIMKAKYIPNP
jgi:hypothetical protein